MSAAIPTVVPRQIVAGDTVTWLTTLADYDPADGWSLGYSMVKRGGGVKIAIPTTTSGSSHLVNVTAATTSAYLPGVYDVHANVTKTATSERFNVGSFVIEILPNYEAAESGVDSRSMARKIFDQIEAAISTGTLRLSVSTVGQGTITEWQAEGLRVKRSTGEEVSLGLSALTKLRDRYAAICANEDAKAALRQGRATGKRILTRFTTP